MTDRFDICHPISAAWECGRSGHPAFAVARVAIPKAINAAEIILVDGENVLIIGENTCIVGANISLGRTALTIGAGGLWSDGVLVQGTDSHGIVDLDTMAIINNVPKQVTLKRRVWLGRNATVLKNVTIEEGVIVGAGALVVKDVPVKACAIAGVPARVVKERVTWSQRRSAILDEEKRQILRLRDEMNLPEA